MFLVERCPCSSSTPPALAFGSVATRI